MSKTNIELNMKQYEILYQAISAAPATDIGQVRVAARVLSKLEEYGTPNPNNDMYVMAGTKTSVTVQFDITEAKVARTLAERHIPHLQAWAAIKILPVLDALGAEDGDQ